MKAKDDPWGGWGLFTDGTLRHEHDLNYEVNLGEIRRRLHYVLEEEPLPKGDTNA